MIVCSLGFGVMAQSIIDSLTGSLSGYTTTMVLDNGHLGGQSVSFSDSASGLQANYVGTGTTAEQAVFLAPVTSFSTVFTVGDTLYVDVATPASSTAMDFGLVVASTATPTAANSTGDSTGAWSSRGTFDWASISVRPSQSSIRINKSVSSTVTTSANVAGVGTTANISELFIQWVSTDSFALGYVSNNVSVVDSTVTFASGSTIGAAIGFYGDLRATGTTLGTLSDLTIVPEPSSLALCGLAFGGLLGFARRKK